MGIKVSKLWSDTKFQNLTDRSKLLYLYLSTNANINIVGVFSPNIKTIGVELNCSIDQVRESCKQLIDCGYIHVRKYHDDVFFIVPDHFNTVPKSEASVLKIQKVLKNLPEGIVSYLEKIGISTTSKVRVFTEPSPEEVTKYALSLGYTVNGKSFCDYYKQQADKFGRNGVWLDGRGKVVNDWRGKLRKVWCKDINKLSATKGAPKGFEFFYVMKDGKSIQPDGWRGGKPFSKDFLSDIILKKEYEKIKT